MFVGDVAGPVQGSWQRVAMLRLNSLQYLPTLPTCLPTSTCTFLAPPTRTQKKIETIKQHHLTVHA